MARGDQARTHPRIYSLPKRRSSADTLEARGRSRGDRAAIRLRPRYAEAYYNLGTALKAQRKLGEALAEFRNVATTLRSAPTSPSSLTGNWPEPTASMTAPMRRPLASVSCLDNERREWLGLISSQ